MTDKQNIPLGKGARDVDAFVHTGVASPARPGTAPPAVVEPEVTKTFRLPASLGRRLKVHAARTGQKEKDILIRLIRDYVDEYEPEA